MKKIIILLSHFIVLFYIFYKNYFHLKMSCKSIIKKYKKLLMFIFLLPIIFFITIKIKLGNYINVFMYFNIYFILFLIFYLIFLICGRDKNLEFYDTSIYVYTYIYLVCIILNNNKSEESFIIFILLLGINYFMIGCQSLVELMIIVNQQFIKKSY